MVVQLEISVNLFLTTVNRSLYLQKILPEGSNYHHPLTISHVLFKSISSYSGKHDVKHHWFAMKLYDDFHDVKPPSINLQEFSEKFEKLMEAVYHKFWVARKVVFFR